MSNFLEELKTTKIISKNDIGKIKKFINIKYKNEDSKRKLIWYLLLFIILLKVK